MEQNSMGRRIMALRKAKGMTQEQLAEKTGVTAQAVSKWENDVSCPDISLLPILSEALGVSTDELLGIKPIEPKVVLVESKRPQDGEQSKGFTVSYGADKKSGIWFAVMVILVGVVFLLTRTNVLPEGMGAGFWGIVWPAVLLGLGVSWFMSDYSPLGLGVGLLGLYYLLFNLGAVTYSLSWGVIWPVIIILFGLTILLDKLVPNRKKHKNYTDHKPVSEYSEANGYVRYDCAFAEENRRMEGTQLAGGDLDVSFGKSTMDLTRVQTVAPGARLKVDVSFGSLEILLPRSIRLDVRSDKAFGSIDVRGEVNENALYCLELEGDVSFGSLVVKYL